MRNEKVERAYTAHRINRRDSSLETIFARTNREFRARPYNVITKQPASHYVKTGNDCFNRLGACYINNTLIYPLSDSVCVCICACDVCIRARG